MDLDPNIQQDRHDSPDPLASHEHGHGDDPGSRRHPPKSTNPYERWSKLPKPRGRQPRDPQGRFVKFQCRDTDDMESALRGYLDAPTAPAEHTIIEFIFPASSAFMVYAADFKNASKQTTENEKQYGKSDRTAISVIDALAANQDAKDRMRRQKAIAKACIEACEQADGFRYSFHNNWLSREDGACRFSYFCNDSTLNKGRAANEGAGMAGKKMRKPVFNCQGLIAVKFSSTKQNVEVHYKHVPLHQTHAERAPPQRVEAKKNLSIDTTNLENSPINPRKRKVVFVETSTHAKPHRPRATEPAVSNTTIEAIDLTREESLQPLVEFLGSANTLDHNGMPSLVGNGGTVIRQRHPLPATAKTTTGPSLIDMRAILPKKPTIPGAMVGSVRRGYLNWTAKAPTDTNKQKASDSQQTAASTTELLPGISEAASAGRQDTASIALSELLALRKKLEEAEERIKRLESEKTPTAPSSQIPPQHAFWPPPSGYTIPQQSQYLYSPQNQQYPPSQSPQGQMRFPPSPQQPFPVAPEDQTPNIPSAAQNSTIESIPARAPKSTPKSTRKSRPKSGFIGSKFVLYTPKVKKTAESNPQSSTVMSTRASSAVNRD